MRGLRLFTVRTLAVLLVATLASAQQMQRITPNFKNADITQVADAVAAATGATGTITWPGNATTSGTLGTTATLLVKPAPTVLPSSGLYLDFTYPTV